MIEKKHVYRLWAVIGVLLAIVAALFAGLGHDQAKEKEAPTISDIHMGGLAGAALANAQGRIAFMIQDGEINILDAPSGVEFSDSIRKAFLYRMAHMSAVKSLGNVEDWKAYGLEDYRAAVALLLKDGNVVRLFLGDQAPFDSGWYLRREGDDSLYLVDDMTAEMMQYSIEDFRKLVVLPGNMNELITGLTRYTVRYRGEEMAIRCVVRDGAVHYILEKPFEAVLSWQTVQTEIFEPLVRLKSTGFVSEGIPGDKYGLTEDNAYTLTFEIAGQTIKLFFSPASENDFYCTREGSGQVILVDKQSVSFLDCSPTDLLDTTLYPGNAADMESVEIAAEDVEGKLEISGQGDLLHGYYNGVMIDQSETLSLFRALTMIPPAEPLDPSQELNGTSIVTLYFRQKDGTEDIVSLIPVSDKRCAVVINGASSFTTYMTAAKEMIRAAKLQF